MSKPSWVRRSDTEVHPQWVLIGRSEPPDLDDGELMGEGAHSQAQPADTSGDHGASGGALNRGSGLRGSLLNNRRFFWRRVGRLVQQATC